MLVKNLPDAHLRPVLRRRVVLDAAAAARLAAAGQRDEAAAILRAWRDFRTLAPGLPRPAPGERLVLPSYRRSVVADYFARGHKRFSDLVAGWA